MNKLISFCVPCFNSQEYMDKCVSSLLPGGDDVEVIIVDDGSSDMTPIIADNYAKDYPSIVSVVHQANGGHGAAVNTGISHARGLYFKVVDSDDWLGEDALHSLLARIKEHLAVNRLPDMYITNYVYEHTSDMTSYTQQYRKLIPANRFVTWKDLRQFRTSSFLMMHSIMYKTARLKECGLVLPEHTFYVDNIYAYVPLPYMNDLYYMDIDLYHYFIGRANQSVNLSNFAKRYDQQNKVMKAMFDAYSFKEIKSMEKHLSRYLFHDLSLIILNTMLFMVAGKDNLSDRKKSHQELMSYFREKDRKLYRKLKYKSYYAIVADMPWAIKRKSMLIGYRIVCRFVKVG